MNPHVVAQVIPQTVKSIIADCVAGALNLPKDPIDVDIIDVALTFYNQYGRMIWDSWPWDDSKAGVILKKVEKDEETNPSDDAGTERPESGVVVLPSSADVVRAVRVVSDDSPDGGYKLFNEDELVALRMGRPVPTESYWIIPSKTEDPEKEYLTPRALESRRRVGLPKELIGKTIGLYIIYRWVDSVVSPSFSTSGSPQRYHRDWPTDYRVMSFPIDRALPALKEYIMDALRKWSGAAPTNAGQTALQVAMARENTHQEKESRVIPRDPYFAEVGSWW